MGDQSHPVFDVLTDRQHAGLAPQRIDINRPPGMYTPRSGRALRIRKTGHPRLMIPGKLSSNVNPIAVCTINGSDPTAALRIDQGGAAIRP